MVGTSECIAKHQCPKVLSVKELPMKSLDLGYLDSSFLENLKLVQNLKNTVSPKLRWLSFSNKNQLDKSTTAYLEEISGVENLQTLSDEQELEAMVRAQLKEEFPSIESMKSYELLVDAVMHNIRKKQLQANSNDNLDIE